MKAHILDGHSLLALPEVVLPERIGEAFEAMNAMVLNDHSLLVVRQVVDLVRHRDPNSPVSIWAETITSATRHTKVPWEWQVKAQDAAQKAGYDGGLEDTLTSQSTGAAEIVGLALLRMESGLDVAVVTEDWTDKPLRPALGDACTLLGVPTCRLGEFLTDNGLGHCLSH